MSVTAAQPSQPAPQPAPQPASLVSTAPEPAPAADTGLGTAYERWALGRLLERFHAAAGFRTAMEGPGDGMTGIPGLNSLPLGRRGVQVTLALPGARLAPQVWAAWDCHAPGAGLQIVEPHGEELPFDDRQFDLVWNFNVLATTGSPDRLLAEMARVSRRYVLLFVPNRANYAFGLHRLHHRVARQPWDHGPLALLTPQAWQYRLGRLGLRHLDTWWVDCPPWPDIVDLSQLLADFFPALRRPLFNRLLRRARPESRLRYEIPGLPYYGPEQQDFQRRMLRLAWFEDSRLPFLKRKFAHHTGVLAEHI